MNRRFFVATWLALAGISRRAWAQVAPIRYAPLTRPVRIPLQQVTEPWRPVPFVAEAMAPATSGTPARRVLINGVVFRTAIAAGEPAAPAAAGRVANGLTALCVTCPHEQCQVDLVTDEARLSRMSGGTAAHPLFECGCHLSIFDAGAEGARVSGEAPRGLFRFRIAGIDQGSVEISDVEEVALFEV